MQQISLKSQQFLSGLPSKSFLSHLFVQYIFCVQIQITTMYIILICQVVLPALLITQATSAFETSKAVKLEDKQVFEQYTDLFPQEKVLPRCGQALTTDNGAIYYKPFEEIQPNERCIWVIGVPGAVGYTVNIQHLGNPRNPSSTDKGLVLTGVRHGPVLTSHKPQSLGYLNVTNANILIVTFYSTLLTDPHSTGFALQYEAIRTGNIGKTANESSHHIFESTTFNFKHPRTAASYVNNELSSFVFPPSGSLYSGGNTNVYYQRSGLESSCIDALYVYTFNHTGAANAIWESKGRICDRDLSVQIRSDEIILILFQSDSSVVSTGFYLTYTIC